MLSGNCRVPIFLAYLASMYIFSSIFYLVMTRNMGTPFNDSLDDKQKLIKAKAVKERKSIFCKGLLISIVLLIIFPPFKNCVG
jgi:hypothetical protein|tara:strand:+ start:13518 stop:13766 length:249 start_codon:yes stop_codon:yes gene_type:complete